MLKNKQFNNTFAIKLDEEKTNSEDFDESGKKNKFQSNKFSAKKVKDSQITFSLMKKNQEKLKFIDGNQ